MKNIFLFIITFLPITNSFAQEIVERKNRLTDSVIERFYVLKTDKSTKQGPYKAIYQRKTLIAAGNYNNGKKIGNWNFYDTKGRLVERYNYDTNTYRFEAQLDTGTNLSFFFDEKIKKSDIVTRPVKVGGVYFGFIPYVSLFQVPFDTFDINTNLFNAYVELLISPGGRLADYKVHLISAYYQYNYTTSMDVNLFSEADRTFLPATLNGVPILSRIFIQCWVTSNGMLNFN